MNKQTLVGVVTGLALLGLLLFGYTWQHTPSERYSPTIQQVQDKAVMIEVPTTYTLVTFIFDKKKVRVEQSTQTTVNVGSGVLVSKSGAVLSCAHVFEGAITGPIIATLSNGTTVEAKLLYADKAKDLALLKLEGNYSAAHLSLRPIKLGQEVIAVGNPNGQQFSTSHGIISHLDRDIGEPYVFTQIDAPINGGNSGGPLFNLQGELIGIVAKKWSGSDGLALAISPTTIKQFLEYFGLN